MSVGSYAEYVCLPQDGVLARKPANLTYEQAAALPVGGLTALYFLEQGASKAGKRSSSMAPPDTVGTFAVQLARHLDAKATGVSSTKNLEWVRSLGADQVIDYTQEDFRESRERYDLIFDAVGKLSEASCKQALAPNGTFVSTGRGIAKDGAGRLGFPSRAGSSRTDQTGHRQKLSVKRGRRGPPVRRNRAQKGQRGPLGGA